MKEKEWAPELLEVLNQTLRDRTSAESIWEFLGVGGNGAAQPRGRAPADERRPTIEH